MGGIPVKRFLVLLLLVAALSGLAAVAHAGPGGHAWPEAGPHEDVWVG